MTDEINHLPSSPSGGTDGIIEANIAHIMLQRSLNYAVAVLTDRALPDIRDGLKPVARHLLYAAHRMGLRVSQKHRKAASLVGETMGKFHPHGDSSIYGALIFQIQQCGPSCTLSSTARATGARWTATVRRRCVTRK